MLKIYLTKNHQYLTVVVRTDDQYDRNNGIFHENTCIENGSISVLESCNDWAEILRNHIEKSTTHEDISKKEEPTA